MKAHELYSGILECHSNLLSEYKKFIKFCGEKTGKTIPFPKNPKELKLDLIYFLLRRNIVLARARKETEK